MFMVLFMTPLGVSQGEGKVLQYGKMHEAIGQQQHQGRVLLQEIVKTPGFFGVGALERLEGEITIVGGKITITGVDAKGELQPWEAKSPDRSAGDQQATMLVGSYVKSWTEHPLEQAVEADNLDRFIGQTAEKAGLDSSQPFMFTLQGELTDLRFHVINGACPMHARLKKRELPENLRPYEGELGKISATLVGVFAKDAVGNLTHPGTSTHMHVLMTDPASGKVITGHVEQVGVRAGAVLRFPK